MPEFTKQVSNPNWELLQQEIMAQWPGATVQTYPRAAPDPQEIRVNDEALDEATLDNIIANHNASNQSDTQIIDSAVEGLKDKIALAHDPAFAPHIRALFNAVLDQTQNQVAQPTRFDNLKAVVDAMPAALRNRFNTDLLAETGLDIVAALPTLTAAQRRQYCQYARVWVIPLVILLTQ